MLHSFAIFLCLVSLLMSRCIVADSRAIKSSNAGKQESEADITFYRRIAIVTGHIGDEPAYVPSLPHNYIDCYFVTNNEGLADYAAESNWKGMHIKNIPVYQSVDGLEYEIFNCERSKQLKVFPQRFLLRNYEYIIWVDNRYHLLMHDILETIREWDQSVAMMLHQRPECCGADLEYRAAMLQPRYLHQKEQIDAYMEEQIALGYPVHGERHFQTGFIIYNMKHADTTAIQEEWYQHITKVGIMCQIAFYFVAQRHLESIQEYKHDWQNGRYSIVTYYDDE